MHCSIGLCPALLEGVYVCSKPKQAGHQRCSPPLHASCTWQRFSTWQLFTLTNPLLPPTRAPATACRLAECSKREGELREAEAHLAAEKARLQAELQKAQAAEEKAHAAAAAAQAQAEKAAADCAWARQQQAELSGD